MRLDRYITSKNKVVNTKTTHPKTFHLFDNDYVFTEVCIFA